ncbi:MAG: hypothetical protein ABSG05_00260 [Candidatus Pacearchaeota archaeon]|jgi:hypothetical protein
MEKLENLKDYLLKGRALNRAFISNDGDVYIVKDLRLADNRDLTLVIDGDFIHWLNPRKRLGFPLNGPYSHLMDRKATFSDIRNAIKRANSEVYQESQ